MCVNHSDIILFIYFIFELRCEYMHLPYGFDFCGTHIHVSMRIKKFNASTNGNPNTAWPTDCGCLPTLSIGTTKSIKITHEHKQSGVWFFREWDALSLDYTAYKPVKQLTYLQNWPIASCALVFLYFGVFFPPALQLRWRDKKQRLTPTKSACMRIHWMLDSYYLWGPLLS